MVIFKLTPLIILVAAASAVLPIHVAPAAHVYLKPHPIRAVLNEEAPAHYEFEYSVNDPQSGDIKHQKEARNGDSVQGVYSFLQPDGFQRIVEYTSSKDDGFHALVRYETQKTKPVAKVHDAVPLKYVLAPTLHEPASAKLTLNPATELGYVHVPTKFLYPSTSYITQDSQIQDHSKMSFAQNQAPQLGHSQVTYAPVFLGRALTRVIYSHPPSRVSYFEAPYQFHQDPSQVIYSQVSTQGSPQFPYQNPSQVTHAQVPITQVSEQIPYQDPGQVPANQDSGLFPYDDPSQMTQGSTQVPYQSTHYNSAQPQLERISNLPRRRAKNFQSRH